jgi:hypothetical protein
VPAILARVARALLLAGLVLTLFSVLAVLQAVAQISGGGYGSHSMADALIEYWYVGPALFFISLVMRLSGNIYSRHSARRRNRL